MFSIRTASIADAEALAELGVRTFRETFAKDNTPQDMALYLAEHFGGGLQRAELEDPSVLFLLLEANGHPAGYVKLRRGPANARGRHPLEICRFYVDHPWHGRGAALELMRGVEATAQTGHDDVWLAVWGHQRTRHPLLPEARLRPGGRATLPTRRRRTDRTG